MSLSMKSLEETGMQGRTRKSTPAFSPGIWSTDDYIRRWAQSQGMEGECIIPLQSLNDEWKAKIKFDQDGHPVERIAMPTQPHFIQQPLGRSDTATPSGVILSDAGA